MSQNDSLPKLASPAVRALEDAGIQGLKQLAKFSEEYISDLHGMGPNALKTLKEAMEAQGFSFSIDKKKQAEEYRAVEEFISEVPKQALSHLNELRKIIKAIVPNFTEYMNYGVPTVKYKGKSLVGYSGLKNHIGFYIYKPPVLEKFKKELEPYETSKGAVKFPLDKPLPVEIIEMLVRERMG